MYLSHYNLLKKPFQLTTDPRFLWLGEKHKEALATLKYGVVDQKGFLLVTGDVGTGKTTLINALLESLEDDTYVANISNPWLNLTSPCRFPSSPPQSPENVSRPLLPKSHRQHPVQRSCSGLLKKISHP